MHGNDACYTITRHVLKASDVDKTNTGNCSFITYEDTIMICVLILGGTL